MEPSRASPEPDAAAAGLSPVPPAVEVELYEACFARDARAIAAIAARHPECRPAIESLAAKVLRADGVVLDLCRESSIGGGDVAGPTALPERIGAYRIERELGRGGFGVVYLARQEAPLQRQVALKVLRPDLGGSEVLRRFSSERAALAAMDHPAIARIYDAGQTGQGQPYFAMEPIDGTSLLAYCDGRRLPIVRRVELFLEVCAAVLHAHQRGVVHRDLKPGNVLVVEHDGRACPKVIDFGLAKALTPDTGIAEMGTTLVGKLLGTPEYMAPEQATGGPVDTRADVHALGVMLFELLTGRLPFDPATLRADGLASVVRTLTEAEPPRPTSVVDGTAAARRATVPGVLRRQLRGDLEAIIARCLQKRPDDRYPGVAELAADLRRHLADEPISVRPLGLAGSLRKLAARHRAVFMGGAVGAASLLLAAVVACVSLWQATLARDDAVAAAQLADARSYRAAIAAAALAGDSCRGPDMRRQLEQAPELHRNLEWQLLAAQTDDALAVYPTGWRHGRSVVACGDRLVLVAEDRLGTLDLAAGTLAPWPIPTSAYPFVAATDPTRTRAFVSFRDGSIHRLDANASPRAIAKVRGGEPALAVAADAAWFVVGDGNTVVGLPGEGGDPLFRWSGRSAPRALTIAPGGDTVAVAWTDGLVEVRRREDGDITFSAPHPVMVRQMVFPNARRLVTSGHDEVIRSWHLDTSLLAAEQPTGAPNVCALVATAEDSVLVSGGGDGSVRHWDATTLRDLGHARGHDRYVCGIDRLADGRLVSFAWDGEVRLWPATAPKRASAWQGLYGTGARLVASPRDPVVFVGTLAGEVGAFDVPAGTLRWRRRLEGRFVHGLAVTPDGGQLVVTTWSGAVHVLSAADGSSVRNVELAKPERLGNVVVHPHSGAVLVAEPTRLHRFAGTDLRADPPLPLAGFEQAVLVETQLSPDGRRLVLCSDRGPVLAIDSATGAVAWRRDNLRVGEVVFAPDGGRLYAASRAGFLAVLDAADGSELKRFGKGDDHPVRTLAITADGRRLLAADQRLRIWDCDRGEELLALDGERFTPERPLLLPEHGLMITASGYFEAPAEILAWRIHPSRTLGR